MELSQQPNQPAGQPVQPSFQPVFQPLATNRKLWKNILLTTVTFGIYWFIFWGRYARDMNIVCAGDGKRTRGAAFRFFIGILTEGIYNYVWIFGNGKRLRENCDRRGIPCSLSGGSALLWSTLGSLILVGPFIVEHKVCSAMNRLCDAYNVAHGYPSAFGPQQAPARLPAGGPQNAPAGQGNAPQFAPNGFEPQAGGQQYAAAGYAAQGTGRQAPVRSMNESGTQEVSDRVHGAVNKTGEAVKNAGDFVRNAAKGLNLEVEDRGGMAWLPILPLVSALCFLLSFIFGLPSQPSLFSVIASLGMALICFLKTEKIKPLSAVPFTVMAVQLLQYVFWRLPYIAYFGLFQWITLLVSLVLMGGAVIHWLLLYANPSGRRVLEMIVPGTMALMALFYLVCFFIPPRERLDLYNQGYGHSFSEFMGNLGNVVFAASYLLLLYRSNFRLLTGLKDAPAPMAASAPADHGYVEVPQPIPPTYGNYQGGSAADQWGNEPGTPGYSAPYTPQAPRMEMEPRVAYEPPRNVFDYQSAPQAPNPQVDTAMAACPSCGYLSPAGTAVCPSCGAPMRARRRRVTSYDA